MKCSALYFRFIIEYQLVNKTDKKEVMDLLIVKNKVVKPQDEPQIERENYIGIDQDGSIKIFEFDFKNDDKKKYLVLFFLSLETKAGFEDVLYLMGEAERFYRLDCQIAGVTSESPYAIAKFMEKDVESGFGFGRKVGFPILCDKGMTLSMKYGVGIPSGSPAKSSIIIDTVGQVRHISLMNQEIKRSCLELARLLAGYQNSDIGLTLKANWTIESEGGIIPNDFEGVRRYYRETYSDSEDQKTSKEGVKRNK